MGFQNENQLKVGALVKATINDKVVEAKVIGIGFNRVTLRSEKGNEATYAFNSEKFLKWFNQVPLNEVSHSNAEKSEKDLLKGLKIVTSGPSVKERTSTPKEKEDRFKLAFGFREANEEGVSMSESMIRDYTLTERKVGSVCCYLRCSLVAMVVKFRRLLLPLLLTLKGLISIPMWSGLK
ncbi:hypothetical protein VN1205_11290 [Helicobacter pylori]|nr:hypothetical protein VN1205_11290 [Helicobacter pylori]